MKRCRLCRFSNNYAIVTIKESEIEKLFEAPQVEFVEMPKRLFFADEAGRSVSCINSVQTPPLLLNGKGVLIGIVDSGADIYHEAFKNSDGTTRIAVLWDQTLEAEAAPPPKGYRIGSFYDSAMINTLLKSEERPLHIPGEDLSGHGTAVLSIAAGSKTENYAGVATESSLAVVKLGVPRPGGFPRTTELMQAVNFLLETAILLQMPIVINISFGNSYGAHNGMSLLETYIDAMAGVWKNCIVIGTGNEGGKEGHTFGQLRTGGIEEIPFVISEYETAFELQIWKMALTVQELSLYTRRTNGRAASAAFRCPAFCARRNRNSFILRRSKSSYDGTGNLYRISSDEKLYYTGTWNIRLRGEKIIDGSYHLWLPGGGVRNIQTRFLYPNPEYTLTIPSTALKPIAVGAYNGYTDAYADFSGTWIYGI